MAMSGSPHDMEKMMLQLQRQMAALQSNMRGQMDSKQSAGKGKGAPKAELRMENLEKLVRELQNENDTLRNKLNTASPGSLSADISPNATPKGPRSPRTPRAQGLPAMKPPSAPTRAAKKMLGMKDVKSISSTGSRGPQSLKMRDINTTDIVVKAGGNEEDLRFLRHGQDILDAFRPTIRCLVAHLINYNFKFQDHIIQPYFRSYVQGGEAYMLYHESTHTDKEKMPRAPFRRPLDIDVFVPIDVQDWSDPSRLERKQDLFIKDLWRIWSRGDVQSFAQMATMKLQANGKELAGPYISTAVSAMFYRDPVTGGPPAVADERMYRKVSIEYYDVSANRNVKLVDFNLKPRCSWGNWEDVYSMDVNAQTLKVDTIHRSGAVVAPKHPDMPGFKLKIRVPSVKRLMAQARQQVVVQHVNGQIILNAPPERCLNPNPMGSSHVPIRAVTDLSRRDWFLQNVVRPTMQDDPDIRRDITEMTIRLNMEEKSRVEWERQKQKQMASVPDLKLKGNASFCEYEEC